MGWSNLALQCSVLCSTWLHQVLHSICIKWKGLEQLAWEQGICFLIELPWNLLLQALILIYLSIIWSTLFSSQNRLPLQPRRIMARRRGKLNGLLLRGLYMDFNHLKPLTFLTKRTAIESFLKSLNKLKGELRWPGKKLFCHMKSSHLLNILVHGNQNLTTFCSTQCRLRELHTLKGHVESVVKLKGLDIETIQQHYTVWRK